MLDGWLVLLAAFGYLSLLFAIAYVGDMRADAGRSLIANPYVYALSLAVYCTSWTFYGSVGRAASSGLVFLTIYLGPTLTFAAGWFFVRKMLLISKSQNITSIADFLGARYGKSHLIAGLVTVIALVGITPYVSLQLKAVAASFDVLIGRGVGVPGAFGTLAHFGDTGLYVALLMAVFSILFGTRHIDASERHEGMVAAIAFESVVKLIAFLAVGLFVVYGLFDGFGDLFANAAKSADLAPLLAGVAVRDQETWVTLLVLSMAAAIFLPRQFQVAVVENVHVRHLSRAVWLFPLYLLAINVFVLPIAVGGLLHLAAQPVDPDTFVLALPLAEGIGPLALLAFIGGLSAATGMIIVETIALSTMICNDLVMPLLFRLRGLRLHEAERLGALVKAIRRAGIVLVLTLGYAYFKLIGGSATLATLGLTSFAAVTQFAPAMILGLYWRRASRRGAAAGLGAGALVWGYTLLLPSFAQAGFVPLAFIDAGPSGIPWLRPQALLGLTGLDPLTHSLVWSLVANVGLLVGVSLFDRQRPIERIQATVFVEIERQSAAEPATPPWRGTASVGDLRALVARFLGTERANEAFAHFARSRAISLAPNRRADAALVQLTERLLGGAIGAASSRVVVASVVKGEGLTMDEMLKVLDEASQVIEYSRQLEQKSAALELASAEVRAANVRLRELDRLKDEFLSTVTHELRTPLTSIRSFTEILHDTPDLPLDRRQEFLSIVIKESQRLTRLINQVLDLARIESGRMTWEMAAVDLADVIGDAAAAMQGIVVEQGITLTLPPLLAETGLPLVWADRDRLVQVLVNLLGNAAKFVPRSGGHIRVLVKVDGRQVRLGVIDNGPGLRPEEREIVFEKFRQAGTTTGNPGGSGLGLAICRRIIDRLGGHIWVETEPGRGAAFWFTLPVADGVTAGDD